jgi:prophage regulatory protein
MELLRTAEVLRRLGLRDRKTLESRVRAGMWVRPVKVGERAIAYPAQEVATVLAARAVGKTNGEVRALVEQLHAQRELQAVQVVAPIQEAAAPSPTTLTPSASTAGLRPGTHLRSSAERWRELVATPVKGGRNAPAR